MYAPDFSGISPSYRAKVGRESRSAVLLASRPSGLVCSLQQIHLEKVTLTSSMFGLGKVTPSSGDLEILTERRVISE